MSKGMPPGWEAKWHPHYSRWYYVNHSTRTTQWEDPRLQSQKPSKEEEAQRKEAEERRLRLEKQERMERERKRAREEEARKREDSNKKLVEDFQDLFIQELVEANNGDRNHFNNVIK